VALKEGLFVRYEDFLIQLGAAVSAPKKQVLLVFTQLTLNFVCKTERQREKQETML
jgi:hypothetical protein